MGENPSKFEGDNNPVESVKWEDAKEFCNKLNAIYADKLPKGYKFNLPTEAQWEYACRAGTTTKYCNGDSDDKYGEVAWYSYNSGYKTHPVGQKKANAWGIYDMHGNVREWCRDILGPYPSSDVTDPEGASSGYAYAKRGGACNTYLRASYDRGDLYGGFDNLVDHGGHIGFRLALVPIQ